MYCVKCGVELADSEKVCPLCGTRVFHPDLPTTECEPPYPREEHFHPEEPHRAGILFLLTALALIPAAICLLCDWRINGGVVWSGFASGGIFLFYIIVLLPMWFNHPNPVIFVPVDFAAVMLYLLYINLAVDGDWFLPFAFPLTGAIAVLVCAFTALMRYLRRAWLFIFGGALILSGGLAVFMEFLINLNFKSGMVFIWSLYPLTIFVLLGIMVLVIAVCKPLRRSLHRRFFV